MADYCGGFVRPGGQVKDLHVSIDGLTVVDDYASGSGLEEQEVMLWARSLYGQSNGGWEKRLWEAYGYAGWGLGSISFGTAPNGRKRLACTGAVSSTLAERVWGRGLRCARLDVQATLWEAGGCDARVLRIYEASAASRLLNPAIRPSPTLIRPAAGGYTCYVGSWHSDKFVRIYNKEVESKNSHYEGAVRYEVVYKKDIAQKCWRHLESESIAAPYLLDLLRGEIRWAGSNEFDCLSDRAITMKSGAAEVSDDERSLEWLRKQVKGTVKRLVMNGRRDEVIDALGLL